ncbi:hypothetical protein PPERSA_11433 [Pseudocohnilembus persalinus]|uniref:Uncharacterized protein n=1 Tax=Pseudocohnilembus persalinus TaxID=266149 RepID=A0A0V0QX68_PSEPJ|nr:hypothetical protein PPERSA_11433 [Pseudocohnilembus persalinus]|eukprot:KRX06788.1 hypothetical protein PPERSA_11433 [Pseudocohnilembus persalinus]
MEGYKMQKISPGPKLINNMSTQKDKQRKNSENLNLSSNPRKRKLSKAYQESGDNSQSVGIQDKNKQTENKLEGQELQKLIKTDNVIQFYLVRIKIIPIHKLIIVITIQFPDIK